MILLALLVMITVAAIVATSVLIFNRTTRNYREEIIIRASKLAAEAPNPLKISANKGETLCITATYWI